MLKKIVLGSVFAAACVAGTAAPASAYHRCSGTVDRQCTYCSWAGGPVQNEWYCDNVGGNWRYEYCEVWVLSGCVVQ